MHMVCVDTTYIHSFSTFLRGLVTYIRQSTLSLVNTVHSRSGDGWYLRMYCIDTKALVFMFNGGSSYGFTIHPIFTRICMLPYVCPSHKNNDMYLHHCFLAPRGYLCSTSLKYQLFLMHMVCVDTTSFEQCTKSKTMRFDALKCVFEPCVSIFYM